MSRIETPADLAKLREEINAQRNAKANLAGSLRGNGLSRLWGRSLADSLEEEIEKRGIGNRLASAGPDATDSANAARWS